MDIRAWAAQFSDEVLLLDGEGFDSAVYGIANIKDSGYVMLYDTEKLYHVLFEDFRADCESDEECDVVVWEHIEFNIRGAWVGNKTPIFTVIMWGEGDEEYVDLTEESWDIYNKNSWSRIAYRFSTGYYVLLSYEEYQKVEGFDNPQIGYYILPQEEENIVGY